MIKFLRTIINRLRYGYKIADELYIIGGTRDSLVIRYRGRKLELGIEHLPGKPSLLFYPSKDPKWLPPHQNEPVSEIDYRFIVDTLAKSYQSDGETIEVLW